MAYEKDPLELGLIYLAYGKPGTVNEKTQYWSGKAFPIPEEATVVFVKGSFIAKPGRPNAGEKVEFYRVLLSPPVEGDPS